jgi:hypothetical protein
MHITAAPLNDSPRYAEAVKPMEHRQMLNVDCHSLSSYAGTRAPIC